MIRLQGIVHRFAGHDAFTIRRNRASLFHLQRVSSCVNFQIVAGIHFQRTFIKCQAFARIHFQCIPVFRINCQARACIHFQLVAVKGQAVAVIHYQRSASKGQTLAVSHNQRSVRCKGQTLAFLHADLSVVRNCNAVSSGINRACAYFCQFGIHLRFVHRIRIIYTFCNAGNLLVACSDAIRCYAGTA